MQSENRNSQKNGKLRRESRENESQRRESLGSGRTEKQRRESIGSGRTEEQRNGIKVMLGLIGMIKPLLGIMVVAIIMGCIGNLMATFITILGGVGIGALLGYFPGVSLKVIFAIIIICAVLRGVLRYTEQASNHYIAFKLLARIRHQVFASLRKLAPAKLDGREKGNLISIITSDIELLEVFYAHTISPIAIAVITSLVMVLFIGQFHVGLGILAAVFYVLVGAVIPIVNGRAGQRYGQEYRSIYGKLNTTVLDNLYGLDEILQYQKQKERQEKMEAYTEQMEGVNHTLKKQGAVQQISTDTVILLGGILILVLSGMLASAGAISPGEAIVCTIAMMSSFGPVAALSALSNNLNQTLASGNRVLNLLAEEPVVEDVHSGVDVPEGDMCIKEVSFAYPVEKNPSANQVLGKSMMAGGSAGRETSEVQRIETDSAVACTAEKETEILKDFSLNIQKNTIHGILGKSGCGKSTLLKLLMRFYETDEGAVLYGNQNVNKIDTVQLRNHISYVTQETFLFQDTIENNIKVAKEDATREEVIEAAKKASIHEFISSLPKGYDTMLKELGDSVSGGERQRIGIARAFLHKAPVILLDEPTSNIDSLNEGIILKSLLEEKKDKTIVLVSHRKSTMGIVDEVTAM